MKELIEFFIKVGRLKSLKRRGWLMRDVADPETVADHAFRVLFLTWIFSRGRAINTKKVLKMALVHSLSAVYIDYISPYDKLLEIKSYSEAQRRYPALVIRAPVQVKELIKNKRFQEEKKAIERLVKELPEDISSKIIDLWVDFETSSSKEAKFLRAIDKLENLLQAIEYRKELRKEFLTPFWAQIREVTDDPNLIRFINGLDQYFREGKAKNRTTQKMIEFIKKLGELKKVRRKGWILRGVKNSESIASHSFRAVLMVWYLSQRRRLDKVVMVLMLLVHNLHAVEIGDHSPHDVFLEKIKDVDRVIETFPWIGLKQEKEVIMKKNLEKESDAVDKLFKYLPPDLRRELKYLWLEFKTGTSKEGRFARQVDRVETVLQAMEYHQKDKSVSPTSFWLGIKELIDDPALLEFVESIDKYYYGAK